MHYRTLLLCASIAAAQPNLFRDQIRPLLEKNCFACHSAKTKMGGLDLSTREALLKGSEHGPVVAAGNPEGSQLYKLVAHISEPHMPFKGKKLPEDAVAKFAEWIRDGVPYGEATTSADSVDAAKVAEHWAFRVPKRPALPGVKAAWAKTPIDRFIAAELERRGIEALPEADRRTLLRRVTVDLTGLLPTAQEMQAYLDDRSPNAYEKVVDRLLASRQHGERWARHWLDIWRYSDWYGYRRSNQVRYSQRHIWRWRDWTVDSINANKPYDRMIAEMLAGDEIAPSDPDVARATGYLARNWYMFNRNVWLQDTIEYTSTAFLGITLKCARCHSHKYDPIPQTDYYRFRAFFEPHDVRIDRVPGEADTLKDGMPRVYDADASRPTYRFQRGNENNPDTSTQLTPGVPQLFGKPSLEIKAIELPRDSWFPDGRGFVPGDMIAQAKAAIEKAEAEAEKAKDKPAPQPAAALKKVEGAKAALVALEARIKADMAALETPVPANIEEMAEHAQKLEKQANILKAEADLMLGNQEFMDAKGDQKKIAAATRKLEAAVKALNEPAEGYTPIGPKFPTTSSGRRLALARWLGAKDNPLTARVAINHMWLRHFGKPLVPTVFNFGRSGKPPSHPELLDWLATEFMDRDWDMRAIHKMIVMSATYRRQSNWSESSAQAKADPDNVTLWRANSHRMEAEAVRDSMLLLSGLLDPKLGGAEIEETKGHEVFRRSIYFRTSPDLQMDMLKVFDIASPNECFERGSSIVPQQALALANSKLSFTVARAIAAKLPADGFVERAFETMLGRPPSAGELRESEAYLREQETVYNTDAAKRARESLVHVLLNHNEFVTVR
ncbi:MAG: PSD1 and planctomycete cytochrome C domain-containing protein [Bryobacteraceae bacterium]